MSSTPLNSSSFGNIVIAIILPFLFLWDFYYAGLRILDLLSIAILFLYFTYHQVSKIPITRSNGLLFVMSYGIIVLYSFVGIYQDSNNYKAIIGFALGSSLFFMLYTVDINRSFLSSVVEKILIISSSLIYLQLVFYYGLGKAINPLSIIGLEARSMSSIYRPSGFFLEPATYSLSTLMLIALYDRLKLSKRYVIFFSLSSVYLTLSLWGILVATLALIYFLRTKALVIIAPLIIIAFFAVLNFLPDYNDSLIFQFFNNRLLNIDTDASANVRYSGLSYIQEMFFSDFSLWLGSGITNEFIHLGASGLSFLINSIGLFSSFLLILALTLLGHSKVRWFLCFMIIFLTAAPLWNYFYWWTWMALYLRSYPYSQNTT